MAKERTINALDLFSGAGGFSFGMEQAGINVVAAIEFDEKIAKTYSFNHKKTIMINDDIRLIRASKSDPDRKTNISSIEEIFNDRNLTVDIIFGGPPCQGFSMAGRRIRKERSFFEDERNLLFLDFIRMVRELRPKVFVIENVPGILNYNGGSVKQEIEKCFEELNYNVKSKVLSAEKFGVPQRRKRAIFIGNNLGIDSEELFPKETVDEMNYVTVWDAIGDLPSLSSNDGNEIAKHTISAKNDYQKIMRSNDDVYYNHVSSTHKPETIKLLKMIKQGQTMKDLPEDMRTKSVHSGAYGRMEQDKVAYTLTTRLNTPSVGRITHPIDHRTITPREAARIQSYPDYYRFIGDITTVGMQIGNSVPPILAKAIGETIIKKAFS